MKEEEEEGPLGAESERKYNASERGKKAKNSDFRNPSRELLQQLLTAEISSARSFLSRVLIYTYTVCCCCCCSASIRVFFFVLLYTLLTFACARMR